MTKDDIHESHKMRYSECGRFSYCLKCGFPDSAPRHASKLLVECPAPVNNLGPGFGHVSSSS